jgi:hypothetical protein
VTVFKHRGNTGLQHMHNMTHLKQAGHGAKLGGREKSSDNYAVLEHRKEHGGHGLREKVELVDEGAKDTKWLTRHKAPHCIQNTTEGEAGAGKGGGRGVRRIKK